MKRALVIIQDPTLRETVLDILHESGFVAIGASMRKLTIAVLRRIREPVVTIVDETAANALDTDGTLDNHARIVLMTGKDRAELQSVNPHGHLLAHLPVPCDVDDLIRLTEAAYSYTGTPDSAVMSKCVC